MRINLKDFYPFYQSDMYIEVSDEVAQELAQWERHERSYRRGMFRRKAYYSLDRGDGLENHVLFVSMSAEEIYERKLSLEQLYAAIASLSDRQAKRIYAYYFLGMSKTEIAKAEGVGKATVGESIQRGLHKIGLILKKETK